MFSHSRVIYYFVNIAHKKGFDCVRKNDYNNIESKDGFSMLQMDISKHENFVSESRA